MAMIRPALPRLAILTVALLVAAGVWWQSSRVSPVTGAVRDPSASPAGSDIAALTEASVTPSVAVASRQNGRCGLAERPPPEFASRNYRRSGFAWILRQLGASEALLDQIARGDVASAVTALKERASNGDGAAINSLGEIAYQHCYLGRDDQTLEAYKAAQFAEAKALPPSDTAWFHAALGGDINFDKRLNAVCGQLIDQNQVLEWVSARAPG